MPRFDKTCVAGLALATLAGSSGALASSVVSYTTALPELAGLYAETDPVDDSYFVQMTITGLPKFDPSLGTLQHISIAFHADFTHDVAVAAGPVTDDNQANEAAYASAFTDLELVYNGSLYGNVIDSYPLIEGLGCANDPFAGPCSESMGLAESWAGPESGGPDITAYGDFDPAHFIGAGEEVSALAISFVSYQLTANGENADGVLVDQTFQLDAGDVGADFNTLTISYEYTVVPLPTAVWLFGSALVGLVGVARRTR